MSERKKHRVRKKHKPPQIDTLDRAAVSDEEEVPRSPRRLRRAAASAASAAGERKWTVQQELQLLRKRSSCLAFKWMHYRMAHFKSIIANILGFPLVVLSGIATAAQYYSQLEPTDDCASSDSTTVLTTAGVLAMVFSTLVTILSAMVAWLKPAEAAEVHRQVSITYQALVDTIEDEMATKEDEREDGRFFMHDIENKMELLAQTAPNVPWFIMRNYTTDWADERELKLDVEAGDSEPRLSTSSSLRLERIDSRHARESREPAREEDEFDLMKNFQQRLQQRMREEKSATLEYQLERAQEHDVPL